jgi:coproporphyrinogen III oxidase
MSAHARARELFGELQDAICGGLEALDGRAKFRQERWSHAPAGDPAAGGGGITRVIEGGRRLEKCGVNLADVHGTLSARLAGRLDVKAQPFAATGLSIVIHPLSPRVPTVHMNLRHIRLEDGVAWFGGGADLTPYYLDEEDVTHFHRTWREVCERHEAGSHARFKQACDAYFRIPHRNEARGVGGIFFDYLKERPEAALDLVADVGRSFLASYVPIVERRADEPWWDREREWQLVRRGRYVEFNLVYDRGTLFGLETGGRAESILISLPPLARWGYAREPHPGSPEAILLDVLRHPRDWV